MEQGNYDPSEDIKFGVEYRPYPIDILEPLSILDGRSYLEEKCKVCRKVFDLALLKKLQKGLLCGPCVEEDKLLRRQKLKERRRELLTDPSKGVTCDVCQRVFLLPSELKKHYDTVHICIRPFACDTCDQKFARIQELKKHQIYKHTDARNYPCSLCNHSFKCANSLRRHEKSHTNVKIYKCEDCGKPLKSKKSLENHKDRHAQKKLLKCDFCKQCFVERSAMELHISEKHKRAKRILCDVCGMSFSKSRALTRHKRVHCTDLFQCETCGLNLKTKYTLKLHYLTLHTSKSETFTCDECGKVFGHLLILNKHKLKHERERKSAGFSCHLCCLRFCSSVNLQRHLLRHSKTKNLKCGDCGKTFLYNFGLMRHVKTVHVNSL